MRPWMRYMVLPVVMVVALLVGVRPVYLFAPLLGYAIWRIGMASLASFDQGAAHIPDGDPEPVDFRVERVTYWCSGCGAELLLLTRGTASPPRHCGERMRERAELPGDLLS
ncbi:MAG: hypothetical protein ACR2MA_02305 [Egibacteraceae bacterium]